MLKLNESFMVTGQTPTNAQEFVNMLDSLNGMLFEKNIPVDLIIEEDKDKELILTYKGIVYCGRKLQDILRTQLTSVSNGSAIKQLLGYQIVYVDVDDYLKIQLDINKGWMEQRLTQQ